MYPIIEFRLADELFKLHTNEVIYNIFIIGAFLHFLFKFRNELGLFKRVLIYLSALFATIFGARIFHLIFERKVSIVEYPHLIFSDLNGMVFYGGFLAGLTILILLSYLIISSKETRSKLFDYTALLSALGYGVLRIACFLNGCCWGRLYAGPFAVQYFNSSSAMPALGMPVFPVQLLDSAIGFFIFFVLLFMNKRFEYCKGKLFLFFIIFYSIGRFFTEFYRGDLARGTTLLLGLSTSQIISIGLFVITVTLVLILYIKRYLHEHKYELSNAFHIL